MIISCLWFCIPNFLIYWLKFWFLVIFRVYCADHTYCTLRLPVDSTAETIQLFSADKLKMRANEDLVLVEVKSNGERMLFKDEDISIPTALSLNGRIFVSPKDHQDALVKLRRSSVLEIRWLFVIADVSHGTRRTYSGNWRRYWVIQYKRTGILHDALWLGPFLVSFIFIIKYRLRFD